MSLIRLSSSERNLHAMHPRTHAAIAILAVLALAMLGAGCGTDEQVVSARANQPKLDRSNFANAATAAWSTVASTP